jgi:hypothetical protein
LGEEKGGVMTTVDSGGVDLGPIGQLQGGIPGFNAVMKTVSRTPEWSQMAGEYQKQREKDFNDAPVGWLAGSSNGAPIYGPPQGVSGALGEIAGAAEGLA